MLLVKITETVMLFLQRTEKWDTSSGARPDDHQLKGFMLNLLS